MPITGLLNATEGCPHNFAANITKCQAFPVHWEKRITRIEIYFGDRFDELFCIGYNNVLAFQRLLLDKTGFMAGLPRLLFCGAGDYK